MARQRLVGAKYLRHHDQLSLIENTIIENVRQLQEQPLVREVASDFESYLSELVSPHSLSKYSTSTTKKSFFQL